MNIQCPGCQFSGDINKTRILEQGRNIKCPKCNLVFRVTPSKETSQPPSEKPPEATETTIISEEAVNSDKNKIEIDETLTEPDEELIGEQEEIPAGFWIRLAAFHLDTLILTYIIFIVELGIAAVVYLANVRVGGGEGPLDIIGALFLSYLKIQDSYYGLLICILIPAFYNILFWYKKGGTPGKLFLGIHVVSINGGYLSPLKAIIRHVCYLISLLPLALGFFRIVFDRQKKAWHDYLSESHVVWVKKFSLFRLILALMLPWLPFLIFFFMFSSMLMMGFSTITQNIIEKAIERGAKAIEKGVKEGIREGVIEYKTLENPEKLVNRPLEKKIEKDMIQLQQGVDSFLYEELLLSLKATGKDSSLNQGPSVTIGPVYIQQTQFWDETKSPHIWLEIRIAPIPNISLKRDFVRLSIKNVIGKSGENLYDHNSAYEKSFNNQLDLDTETDKNYYTSIRKVYLLPGTKENDIVSISGQMTFNLPLNIKTVNKVLDTWSIEEELNIYENNIKISDFNENMILLNYSGDIRKLIAIYGFDKDENRIRQRGRSRQGNGKVYNLKYHFYGPVDRIQILVAEGFMQKMFPFKL